MQYILNFIMGLFLVNGLPHFVKGIVGEEFYTPFSTPPTKALSSPLINLVWGLSNFLIAYFMSF